MNDEIQYFEKLRDHVTNMTGIEMRSAIRTEEYVALRCAFFYLLKSATRESLTYERMGAIVGRNYGTLLHYNRIIENVNPNTKFGKYYLDWVAKLEEMLPLLKTKHRILCRALIGFF